VAPSQEPTSKPFGFPPSSTPESLLPVALAASPSSFPLPSRSSAATLAAQVVPQSSPVGSSQPCFAPPSSSGAAELGEKLRSPLPVLQSTKPFQSYYRRAKELSKEHSVKWNEVLLADSLVASKTFVGSFKKDLGRKYFI
jgi:hypothetical protein